MSESTLDLDVNLDALACDALNSSLLYAVEGRHSMNMSAQVNGRSLNGKRLRAENGFSAAKLNGQLPLEMSEDTVRDSFGRFGAVKRVTVPGKPEKCAKHAFISKSNAYCWNIFCIFAVTVRIQSDKFIIKVRLSNRI